MFTHIISNIYDHLEIIIKISHQHIHTSFIQEINIHFCLRVPLSKPVSQHHHSLICIHASLCHLCINLFSTFMYSMNSLHMEIFVQLFSYCNFLSALMKAFKFLYPPMIMIFFVKINQSKFINIQICPEVFVAVTACRPHMNVCVYSDTSHCSIAQYTLC